MEITQSWTRVTFSTASHKLNDSLICISIACGWLLQLELEPRRLGAVYVKPRHLISDLVSLDTASMWSRCYHGNQQQFMSIQLVHLKGNRGALEAFTMLMHYKIAKLT